MRKYSKGLILTLCLISMLLPFLPITVNAQDEMPVFVVGACGARPIANWDPACFVTSTGDYYMFSAIEPLYAVYDGWSGLYNEFTPVLATSWEFEYRPDEMNAAGFINRGGIKSMEFTLRPNVTFHDGSDWNATVCKWNIDRIMRITGNISGILPSTIPQSLISVRSTWWLKVADWEDYETVGWNVTQFKGVPSTYAEYGASGDYVSYFPRIAGVTITEDLQSGGKVNISFNDWGRGPGYIGGAVGIRFMSMDAYKAYEDTIMEGYETGDLIGTGPYQFVGHNLGSGIGTMNRFDDWWNATAAQAQGWHMVPYVALATFAHSEDGYQARSTAIVAGEIDWAYDRSWEPLNYQDMLDAPDIRYIPMGLENYGENVILNCINETWMKTYFADGGIPMNTDPYNVYPGLQYPFMGSGIMNPDGTINARGINRAFRKAISYAFDYPTYIDTAFEGRVERGGGLLPKNNIYYNSSIPLAYYDLDIARQALLDDPFWGPICADRHLDLSNSTDEWDHIAATNPIYKMEYSYDDAHLETKNLMTTSLEHIGCGITLTKNEPDTYTSMTGGTWSFPWFTCDGFAIKWYYTRTNVLGYIQAYYKGNSLTDGQFFPYSGFMNMGFNYNDTCDDLIAQMWFQNSTGQQDSYNKLCDWAQNYQYPQIYLANDLIGHAVDKDWDYSWYWGFMHYELIKYTPRERERALIPGYSINLVLSASLIAILGIGYTIIRKKRHM
ncbi:MAG: ABC transporter substrate-binding protein [Candidatus Thorarchaeota archaeon]